MSESENLKNPGATLTPGVYNLHVYIQRVTKLAAPDGETIDAIVRTHAFGTYKDSTAKDDLTATSSVFYGEHFHFTITAEEKEDILG